MDLTRARILVTGGSGFLGAHVLRALERHGHRNVASPSSADYDLRDAAAVARLVADTAPNVVIHLAARVGGIGANRACPGDFFFQNLMMGAQLMDEARRGGVRKFVGIGTICAYPRVAALPFREDAIWDGYPDPTNAPYGLAKKMLLVQGQAYRDQFGFNAIHLVPVNLYGPGDHFDLETSHVIPALIRKCVDAVRCGATEITLWGDGSPTREFLYVEDAAEAIVLATERYDGPDPVNVGAGAEISIRDLATTIARETGFGGRIVWDTTRPNGQPRRLLDVTRAEAAFGFRATTGFAEGLRRTIAWYRAATA
jgi:GDP-L-fucose synthase